MANQEHLDLIKQGVEPWNQWREENPEMRPDLSGANLRGVNLVGARLEEANLRKVNLAKANLTGADLWEVNLWGANLSRANLTRANLWGGRLTRANLTEANLWGARLEGANLSKANLSKANLTGISLTRADLSEANLEGANLSGAGLTGADLIGASLRAVNLVGASLEGASLTGTDLWEVNLRGANLKGANLSRSVLRGANLTRSDLTEANLARANLTKANLSGANLTRANLTRANLTGTNLEGVSLSGAILTRAVLEGANLIEATLIRARLQGASLVGANLTGAGLEGAILIEADLNEATLEQAELKRAVLKRADTDSLRRLTQLREQSTADRVQFTVYHPKEVKPVVWYTLLAYTHLPTTIEEIKADSRTRLRQETKSHRKGSDETTQFIKRGAEIAVVPELPGCRFNPPQASFLWLEDWHRLEFRLQAGPDLPGFELDAVVNGRLAFYVGPILVGEVPIWAYVSQEPEEPITDQPDTEATADIYQAIFVSYAHNDTAIVEQLEEAYANLGMQYTRDVHILRSGEKWNPALPKIEIADVFQLCWSANAKRSPYVEQEWRRALQQNRPGFIRPIYWENPMPEPPPELSDIQFAYLEL